MACGCIVIASNDNLRGEISDDLIFKQGDTDELKNKIERVMNYSEKERLDILSRLSDFSNKHSLSILSDKLFKIIK